MNTRRYSKFLAVIVASLILLSMVGTSSMAAAGETTRISVASDSIQWNNEVREPTISTMYSSPVMSFTNIDQIGSLTSSSLPVSLAQTGQGFGAPIQVRYATGTYVWTSIGLTGKNISILAIDPTTPSTIYAGAGDGVFKSMNDGGNWNAVTTGLTNLHVYALAIDPTTPNTLYAGTGDGVFKSMNGGGNWSAVTTGLTNLYVHALAIDPTTPSMLYAGTDGGTVNGGVFNSTNSGENWSAVNTGLTYGSFTPYITALAIDPGTPSTVYAGAIFGDGLFKSTTGAVAGAR